MEEEKIIFCKSGGCTAKLGAGVLEHILEKLPKGEKDPNLLVGYDSKDDASVYRLTTLRWSRRWISFRRWWRIRTRLEKLRRRMP